MQRRLPGMRPDYLVQQREIQERKLAEATEYDQKMKLIVDLLRLQQSKFSSRIVN